MLDPSFDLAKAYTQYVIDPTEKTLGSDAALEKQLKLNKIAATDVVFKANAPSDYPTDAASAKQLERVAIKADCIHSDGCSCGILRG
jgi:hypothetical protein